MLSAAVLARVLAGERSSSDSVLAPGPGHSRRDRSLSVKIAPDAPGGLLIYSHANDDWRACRDHVFAALGIRQDVFYPRRVIRALPQVASLDGAERLWRESISPSGSLVEKYLFSRGLGLPSNTDAIRFHPSCPFGPGQRRPCMVGLYRDICSNDPRAIHRTALTAEGRKIDRKALGPKSRCAIKLSSDEDVALGLAIGEGVETALGGMQQGFLPAWALGDVGEISRFPVLSGIDCLTIFVDNDASGTGMASAVKCSKNWTAAGREVLRIIPNSIGTDMADIASDEVAR